MRGGYFVGSVIFTGEARLHFLLGNFIFANNFCLFLESFQSFAGKQSLTGSCVERRQLLTGPRKASREDDDERAVS